MLEQEGFPAAGRVSGTLSEENCLIDWDLMGLMGFNGIL